MSEARRRRAARQPHRGWEAAALVVTGSALTAVSFNLLLRTNGVVPGGIVGASLVLEKLSGLEPALGQWVLNAIIMVVCARTLGRAAVLKGVAGSVLIPLVILFTRGLPCATDNLLLAALCGGAGVGAGVGLVFRAGGSVGGFSAAALAAHRRWGAGVDHVMLGLDAAVLVVAAGYFSGEQVLCSLLSVFVMGRVARGVMTGFNRSRVALIVSDRAGEIRQAVLHELGLGLTVLPARGGYTNQERAVLLVVLEPAEAVRLKARVRVIDPGAFVIVSDATEVLGHGFAPH